MFSIDQLKFDANGLIPAVIQDVANNEILMVGYMNKEAVQKTIEGPHVTFYSRSRNKMWIKGESSGHTQQVKEIYFDCDADCLLIKVIQKVAACHVGYRTCFFRKIEKDKVITVGEKIFEEEKVYKK
ncbi:MAG TPA: phosphoribosyl-AMP cyclohydrolase [Deltaproteobacteria bacterium]|nr:MAG: phosphoribosyl-AMP cyclohydrolase [Deltaproteobacteria bacterium GWA2_45_12]HBF12863.1 phosphoribosyl-AMP cyclohydrolase [Deltaproteobacteria bacterium]